MPKKHHFAFPVHMTFSSSMKCDEGSQVLCSNTAPCGGLATRPTREKAVVAVAHSLLVIVFHILRDDTTYRELGHDYFDKRDTADSSTASPRAWSRWGSARRRNPSLRLHR